MSQAWVVSVSYFCSLQCPSYSARIGFIFNANYSLFPVVGLQVPGALLALKIGISKSKKLVI